MFLGDLIRCIKSGKKYAVPRKHDGGTGVVFYVNHHEKDTQLLKMANIAMERHGNIPVLFRGKPEIKIVEVPVEHVDGEKPEDKKSKNKKAKKK